jgi:hypothetical protein
MAKIEMDMSEYEAMKKVENNLQASLDNERDLRNKIEELQKENIRVLEEAKHKVVIETIETVEEIRIKRIDHGLDYLSSGNFTHPFIYGLEKAVSELKLGNLTPSIFLDRFAEKNFQKSEFKSGPNKTYKYSQSIKDLENEIQTRLEEGMDKEYKETLEFGNKCMIDNKKLKEEISSCIKYSEKLTKDLEEANIELEKTNDKYLNCQERGKENLKNNIVNTRKIANITKALGSKWMNLFTRTSKIRKILRDE